MADTAPVLKQIPVNRILPSRHQARKFFDEDGLKGLADSIDKEGLLEPVMVRLVSAPNPLPEGHTATLNQSQSSGSGQAPNQSGSGQDWYELVYGERRWRACKLLGRDIMDAIVTAVVSEAASAAKGLVENLQREGMNPIEEAEGFDHLNKLDPGYWTHEQIASVAGRVEVILPNPLECSSCRIH